MMSRNASRCARLTAFRLIRNHEETEDQLMKKYLIISGKAAFDACAVVGLVKTR